MEKKQSRRQQMKTEKVPPITEDCLGFSMKKMETNGGTWEIVQLLCGVLMYWRPDKRWTSRNKQRPMKLESEFHSIAGVGIFFSKVFISIAF